MKPYLAVFRAGPSSLHPEAVARLQAQNFDFALSWFGDGPPHAADGAVFVHHQKGAKWPGLEQTLRTHWETIQQYRYIWLPDDDLLCVPEDVSRLFAICEDLELELAQPALTPDSYYTHLITVQHSAFQLRFTNFVEIMAPVFSRDMLARVLHTLSGQISGFGLDALWPRYTRLGKVAVVDDTPVKHTRPLFGPNHLHNKKAGLTPIQEDLLVSAATGIEDPWGYHLNYAGLLQTGDTLCIGTKGQELDALLEALSTSIRPLNASALLSTLYLSNHLDYWRGAHQGGPRYPRDMLRIVLNRNFKHLGLRFRSTLADGPAARPAHAQPEDTRPADTQPAAPLVAHA